MPEPSATAEQGDDAWSERWDQLCHQGTTTTASYAAVPDLAAVALRQEPAPFIPPLFLVAAILSAGDRPVGVDVARVRRQHADQLADLEHLAAQCLNLPAVRDDPASFIHHLQVVVTLRDEPIWQEHLTGLANGEYEILCPSCGGDLYVTIDTDAAFVTEGYTPAERRRRTPIDPADPPRIGGAAERLHRLAVDHHQQPVARMISWLFGQGTCPACRTAFPIPEAVTSDR